MAQPTTPDAPTPNGTAPETPAAVTTPAQDATLLERALFEIKRVIVGQDRMVERMFVALLARGHCLLEGVPGVAKTLAVETLARVVGGQFARVQFTPDLVPADIMGTRIYRQSSEKFDVELGPVFVNFLLADEINRAPAKVQSALLEVMSRAAGLHRRPDPPGARPVPGDGHPEPDRAGGRLPAAGGAAGPLPDEDRRRVPHRRGGAGDRLPDGRRRARAGAGLHRRRPAGPATQGRPGLRAQRAGRLRRPAGAGHPQPRRARHARRGPADPVRGQPARLARPDPGHPGAGAAARPGLRVAAGRPGHRTGHPAAPAGAQL